MIALFGSQSVLLTQVDMLATFEVSIVHNAVETRLRSWHKQMN